MRFITSASPLEIRALAAMHGASVTPADLEDTPRWAESIIDGGEVASRSVALAVASLGYKLDAWRPRPVIADPTFALAAQSIERNGGSSAPAAAYAR